MFCCLARLTFNFLLFFSPSLNRYEPSANCLNTGQHNLVLNYIYLSLGYSIMHVMPILTFIIIYEPEIENNKASESLLSATKSIKDNIKTSAQYYLLGGREDEETRESAETDEGGMVISK